MDKFTFPDINTFKPTEGGYMMIRSYDERMYLVPLEETGLARKRRGREDDLTFADINPFKPVEVGYTFDGKDVRTYVVPLLDSGLFVDRAGTILAKGSYRTPAEGQIPVMFGEKRKNPAEMKTPYAPTSWTLADVAMRDARENLQPVRIFDDGSVEYLAVDERLGMYSAIDSIDERGPTMQRYGPLVPLLAQQADRVCREQGLDDEYRAPMVRSMEYGGKSHIAVLFREDLQEILQTIERGLGKEYAMQAHDRNGPALAYAAKSASPAGR